RTGATALLIEMEGGGACWDGDTCHPNPTLRGQPNWGPEGTIERVRYDLASSLDSQTWSQTYAKSPSVGGPNSPFASVYNIVKIPYCTGDVHAGFKTQSYTDGQGVTRTLYHNGYNNLKLMLPQIHANFPNPSKVVLEGGSAGGLGTQCNL